MKLGMLLRSVLGIVILVQLGIPTAMAHTPPIAAPAAVGLLAPPSATLACPDAATEAIDQISAAVAALGLPAGQANSLEATLNAARAAVSSGNPNAASGPLRALESQIRALINSGQISAEQGEFLLTLVQQAVTTITNCPVVVFSCRSGNQQDTLFWLNPPGPYASTRILFRTDAFPSGPADPNATLLGDFAGMPGAVGSAPHNGLANGTTYYYAAYANDGTGDFSAAKTTWCRPDASVAWSYNVGSSDTPIVGGSFTAYYVVSSNGFLHALTRGENGGFWPTGWTPPRVGLPVRESSSQRPTFLPLQTPISGTNQLVLVPSRDGRVYAVNGDTGAMVWTSQVLGSELRASLCGSLKAFGGVDVVMFGTYDVAGDNRFYGLNLADGSVAWVFDNGGGANGIGPISTGCALSGTRVFFTSLGNTGGSQDSVWALDFTGTTVAKAWSANAGDVVTSASTRPPGTVCPDGCVYVGNAAGEVHKLSASTGAPIWATPYLTGDGPLKGFVSRDFFGNLSVFSTNTKAHLLADTGASFSAIWTPPVQFANPSITVFLRFSDGNHRVYVGDADSRVYELSAIVTAPTKDKSILLGDPARLKQPGLAFFDVGVSPQMTFWGTNEGVLYGFKFPFP